MIPERWAWVPGYKGKSEVNHKDLDKTNNRADNLEWVTHAGNMKHLADSGRRQGEGAGNVYLTWKLVRRMRRLWATGGYYQRELARMFNTTPVNVGTIVSNRTWKEADLS
jgi:hypothetical protein